jgi:hypothetical protein
MIMYNVVVVYLLKARGVVRALEATFLHVGKSLEGSTIAIQVTNKKITIKL